MPALRWLAACLMVQQSVTLGAVGWFFGLGIIQLFKDYFPRRVVLEPHNAAALAGIVMDLLRKLAAVQDACVIAVTHDEKIYGRFDRLFHLRDGQLDHDEVNWYYFAGMPVSISPTQ